MICDIQVVPSPTGTATNEFKHVDAAIAVIAASGLKHTVHALGTTIEGPPDAVWDVARRAFDACLESGASKELMYLKLYQGERTVAELEASGQKCAAGARKARHPAAAPEPAARASSPSKRPRGRPPKDKLRDAPQGTSVAASDAEEAPKRPRGRPPKGKVWDAKQGWVAHLEAEVVEVEGVEVEQGDDAAEEDEEAAAAEAEEEQQQEQEEEDDDEKGEEAEIDEPEEEAAPAPAGGLKRPRGRPPKGKVWDAKQGWIACLRAEVVEEIEQGDEAEAEEAETEEAESDAEEEAAAAAKEKGGQRQRGEEPEEEEAVSAPAGGLKRPRGRPPAGKKWDTMVGWVDA